MVIIGLGNPDKKYFNTYHNIGFMFLDELSNRLNMEFKHKECNAIVAKRFIDGENIVLAKPTTYMNLSGESVRELKGCYSENNKDLIVICDDIELEMGKIRVRAKGSGGTHNGLKNIVLNIGQEFIRVRMGVGRGDNPEMDLKDFVLSNINDEKKVLINDAIKRAADGIIEYIKSKDIEALMRRLNG